LLLWYQILKVVDNWSVFLTPLALFIVYVLTTSPAPLLEDDALFILASFDRGLAHSPGYPLYVLLTQPFHWLPIGSVALKVHLANAVAAAILAGLLAVKLCRHFNLSRGLAAASVLSLGFSALFWNQALIAEVYMLNALLFVLIFFTTLELSENEVGFARRLFQLSLLFGLSLANHWPLTLLMSPVFLILVWPVLAKLLQQLHIVLAGLAIGLLPYLWMYFRSSDPIFSQMGAFTSINEFIFFITREVYAGPDSDPLVTWHDKVLYLKFYCKQFLSQFSVPALVFILLGFVMQWFLLARRICFAMTVSLLLPVVLILLLDFTFTRLQFVSMSVYPLPLYVVAAMWLALGLLWVSNMLVQKTEHAPKIMFITGLILIASTGYKNYDISNSSGDSWAVDHATELLDSLPDNTNLFVMDDWLMAVTIYLHHVERHRPDVTVYSEYGTFLPNRLFPYFATSVVDKQKIVRDFIQRSSTPVVVLQNPGQYGLPFTDAKNSYWINPARFDVSAPDVSLASGTYSEPSGDWNDLRWRYLVRRLPYHVFAPGNFVVSLSEANRFLDIIRL
jgi:hypothetical protein